MDSDEKFNEEPDVIDYTLAILESQIREKNKKLETETDQLRDRVQLYEKLFAIASDKAGYPIINMDSLFDLPDDIKGQIFDKMKDVPEDLIQPSHSYLPYSLLRAEPELEQHIPHQSLKSIASLLNSCATSRAHEIINEYNSKNTLLAHKGDLVYWQAWLSAVGNDFKNPITEKDIITFIVQHVEGIDTAIDSKLVDQGYKAKKGTHKLATVKRRIGSLSVFLDRANWENPCRNTAVKLLLQKLTKKYGSSKPSGKAITKDVLDDMIDTCNTTKLIDIRDKALLLFAWGSGGRRRAEVTAADMKDLVKTPEGNYTYTIPQSKTDQEGKGNPVPVRGRVARALSEWLTVSGITSGPIFRAVNKGGEIMCKLSPVDVNRIVRRRLKKAQYDETEYTAHSLRSGFVTEAGRRGKPLGDVMQMTTHKSVATAMRYYQSGNIMNNSASELAE